MEASTVSPPPALPTEAEDPCEIDVTTVAIHIVTLLISLSGLVGNGAVVCLFSLKLPNTRIFDQAVVDFLFLLFVIPSSLLLLVEDVSCSTIMPLAYLSFLFQLPIISYYWALWLLADVSIVMGLHKLCQLCCRCHLSYRLLCVILRIQYWAFFLSVTVTPTMSSLCPSHEQEYCQVALTSMFPIILLIFAVPTVISILINLIRAKCSSQQQQPKKYEIITFLIVLFTLLLIIWNFLQHFGYAVVSSQVFFLFTCINSTIKPFIYFLLGRCWRNCSVASLRDSLRRVFEEPEGDTACSNDAAKDSVL